MNITVYLASSSGNNPNFSEKAAELGAWIAKNGHTLVYGGSNCGLMGILATSVLDNGGEVIGVEPQFFIDLGKYYDRVKNLIVTETMAERRTKMIELGDAFIAFPGGTGTLEEISEVMSKTALPGTPNFTPAPCILYNVDGFWNPLKTLLDNMRSADFTDNERLKGIEFAENIEDIKKILGGDV